MFATSALIGRSRFQQKTPATSRSTVRFGNATSVCRRSFEPDAHLPPSVIVSISFFLLMVCPDKINGPDDKNK